MHEPEAEAEPWSFLNIENIFSNNYYGDSSQHDVKICHEQYITDTNYAYIDNDEIIARSLLQEELSQLSIAEESPKLSHSGEEYLQNSNIVPNWHNSSNDYYLEQEGVQNESDDEASLCSSPEDRSCDGENYYYTLDITDGSELDGEVEKRLYQMIPVPHIPRINGDIPSIDEATSDHQRLLDRLQLYDLIEHKVQGDGNCQFRALSDQFYRTPEHHKFVRQQVVRQLKAHPEIYEGYVPMKYADYLKRMSKSEEWGDHVTLQAAADSPISHARFSLSAYDMVLICSHIFELLGRGALQLDLSPRRSSPERSQEKEEVVELSKQAIDETSKTYRVIICPSHPV
ncbi:OTU-like cysteine protease family protein [Striga asiatica]|uniref:OTU-like cysteine protease family protein n=1 Tax=Striga asiatica TaxID=4170 RepID=A0A5A7RA31_STRAF|nr:OTU-like cysteine protease family protein [Striga asiatica]